MGNFTALFEVSVFCRSPGWVGHVPAQAVMISKGASDLPSILSLLRRAHIGQPHPWPWMQQLFVLRPPAGPLPGCKPPPIELVETILECLPPFFPVGTTKGWKPVNPQNKMHFYNRLFWLRVETWLFLSQKGGRRTDEDREIWNWEKSWRFHFSVKKL